MDRFVEARSEEISEACAVQKKSKKGVKTPKAVIDLIEERLAYASEVYEEWRQENPEERN